MLVCFLVFRQLMREHLVILTDVVSRCTTFSEAPRLALKCGTHRSDSPIRVCNPPRRGCGKPTKAGLLYPIMWIPCNGIVFVGVAKQSRLLNK
jgi:hypothetical protein